MVGIRSKLGRQYENRGALFNPVNWFNLIGFTCTVIFWAIFSPEPYSLKWHWSLLFFIITVFITFVGMVYFDIKPLEWDERDDWQKVDYMRKMGTKDLTEEQIEEGLWLIQNKAN